MLANGPGCKVLLLQQLCAGATAMLAWLGQARRALESLPPLAATAASWGMAATAAAGGECKGGGEPARTPWDPHVPPPDETGRVQLANTTPAVFQRNPHACRANELMRHVGPMSKSRETHSPLQWATPFPPWQGDRAAHRPRVP